ncbi:MAG: methylenetetrahydrofolate--tRNA-(uracil(54)-C(5))-methyltransferase (FADH(2)-oxidizing) TrmFO [Coriobacteriia bacterium]|nr:methylenetetrahydrofolate--tRNA-(uracil(54)-C(5))-methyltransferase (FADH(2)-oxidizing) TrmFO [Coriobacteriia bacterium]
MTFSQDSTSRDRVTVLGGGLAGCEAAWQLALRGIPVRLIEMRPTRYTPAHHTADLGELVCSNSLKGMSPNTAAGLLKSEMAMLGSVVLQTAHRTRVAAGGSLAVDRDLFARTLTQRIEGHPRIEVLREEADALPDGHTIIATGPLTSPALERVLTRLVGNELLSFYDAASPIVLGESLDEGSLFAQSRYGKGEGDDYLNAPMTREEYDLFYDALVAAQRAMPKDFERMELFQACQPVEEVARTGRDALRFGALKPVGLTDPGTGLRPWAVVQLRAENADRTIWGLVGFQTNLTFAEQRRVFGLIPALRDAEFLRFGVMHRNTFVEAPNVVDPTLTLKDHPCIRLAGQITGTEGYLEAAASGLLAALNTWADITGHESVILPKTTALGALIGYATDPATAHYQPMHVNFGLVPPLAKRVRGKQERYAAYVERACTDLAEWCAARPDLELPMKTDHE